jgi:hypothetical protein
MFYKQGRKRDPKNPTAIEKIEGKAHLSGRRK